MRRHRKVTGNIPSGPADFIPVVEMQVGDIFTVHSCNQEALGYKDNSYQGDILTVTAISAPYIFALWATGTNRWEEKEIKVDTRAFNFIGVTDEYIDRMLKLKEQYRRSRGY